MNTPSQGDLLEATRLTRAGRLTEASALLQRMLGGRGQTRPAPTPPRAPGSSKPAAPRLIEFATAAPQPSASEPNGGTNSFADASVRVEPAPWARTSWPKARGQGATAAALKGLLGGLGGTAPSGLLSGLPGLDGMDSAREPVLLPERARFETATYANAAGSRRYKLYVPSTHGGKPLPLVVMLHGCTQSPDDFAAGTRMNELAEEHGLLVAYPEQASSANARKCWNWFSPGDQERDAGEPSIIAGITRQIMADHAVDPDRVYVAGLSAGGAAAAIMGETYPDLYAAVGVHSGLACGAAHDLPSALAAMRQGGPISGHRSGSRDLVPTIVFHGDRDTIVSPTNGDQVMARAKAGAALDRAQSRERTTGGATYTRVIEADGSKDPVLEQWVLHGTGHAWSGGSAAGSYTDPAGPDASREMVRFFLAHPRRD